MLPIKVIIASAKPNCCEFGRVNFFDMNYSFQNDKLSLCEMDTCLHLNRNNAKVISTILTVVTFVAAISVIAKAIK